MTRKEYMEDLANRLRFVAEDERQRLLEMYDEALADRMEDGMDEASAVAAMERPEDIAHRLLNDPGVPKNEPMADMALQFSSLVDSVLKSAEKAIQSASDAIQRREKAEESVEFAEAASDVMRENTEQENWGEYEQKTLTIPASRLRAVKLICGEKPIRVKIWNESDVMLVYYTCGDDPYEAAEQDGALILQKGAVSKTVGRFTFSLPGGFLRFGWKSAPTVELYLPPDAALALEIHTSNASIKIREAQALQAVQLKTSNSRILLEGVKCASLDATTSNGRVGLENVNIQGRTSCKTSNSRVEVSDTAVGGDMLLTTSNARITVYDSTAGGEMRLTTSNSGIQAENADALALTMKTSNGGISALLPSRQQDWQITSGASNGHNSLPAFQPGSKRLDVHTSNGSIDVQFQCGV